MPFWFCWRFPSALSSGKSPKSLQGPITVSLLYQGSPYSESLLQKFCWKPGFCFGIQFFLHLLRSTFGRAFEAGSMGQGLRGMVQNSPSYKRNPKMMVFKRNLLLQEAIFRWSMLNLGNSGEVYMLTTSKDKISIKRCQAFWFGLEDPDQSSGRKMSQLYPHKMHNIWEPSQCIVHSLQQVCRLYPNLSQFKVNKSWKGYCINAEQLATFIKEWTCATCI